MLAGLVSSEVSLLGLQLAAVPVTSRGRLLVCAYIVCVLISASYRTSHTGSGPTSVTSFYLPRIQKFLAPNSATF